MAGLSQSFRQRVPLCSPPPHHTTHGGRGTASLSLSPSFFLPHCLRILVPFQNLTSHSLALLCKLQSPFLCDYNFFLFFLFF